MRMQFRRGGARHGGHLNEPARDLNSRSAAQDELDSILREAEASRGTGPKPVAPERLAPPTGPVSQARRAAGEAAAAQLAEATRFKMPEPGVDESLISRIPLRPVAIVLGIAAAILW